MSNNESPWAPSASGPVRRKVAWGTGSDSEQSPAPRAGAAGKPSFGDAFSLDPQAGPDASSFAQLHAGADPGETSGLGSLFDESPLESPEAGPQPVSPAAVAEPAFASPFDAEPFDAEPFDAEPFTPEPFTPEPFTPEPAAFELPQPQADLDDGPAVDELPAEAGSDLLSMFAGDDELAGAAAEPSAEAVTEPASAPRKGLDLAARRAAVEAARGDSAHMTLQLSAEQASNSQRYAQQDHYYGAVDRILGVGQSGDPALQAMIRTLELTRDKDLDRAQRRNYQDVVEPLLARQNIHIGNPADNEPVFDIAYDEMLGIGPLGPLWRDDSVSEIMVSGPYKVTVERNGRLETTPVRFRSQEHLERTARTLAARSVDDRSISATNPLVTIQLPRARVQFVWRPLAVAKVAIAIRKFGDLMGLSQLMEYGSLSAEMAEFLDDAVVARATLLVSGGTGSGKTTFINAVSEFIPETERVITIEDALELQLRNTHIESFITKEAASADDTMLFGQDQLLKASLRMRPDRIIVGEIRDGRGCSVMLEAANTGHDGTMTTIHANSAELALHRMATLLRRVEAMPDEVARAEVHSAIDVVVQVVRTRGRRFVSEISLVDPARPDSPVLQLFVGEFPAGAEHPLFRRVGAVGTDTDLARKMADAGLDPNTWR